MAWPSFSKLFESWKPKIQWKKKVLFLKTCTTNQPTTVSVENFAKKKNLAIILTEASFGGRRIRLTFWLAVFLVRVRRIGKSWNCKEVACLLPPLRWWYRYANNSCRFRDWMSGVRRSPPSARTTINIIDLIWGKFCCGNRFWWI